MIVAVDLDLVWCAGRAEVRCRRAVGRAGVNGRFAAGGLANAVRPDLDALRLGPVCSPCTLHVYVLDEAVELLPVWGRCVGSPRIGEC